MSEAIIARKSIAKVTYKYETIYNNIYVDIEQIIYNPPLSSFVPMSMSYTVPTNLANNQITVALSGAKGSDNETSSGSNGELVVETLSVQPGETIPIYIGEEGTDGNNGGSSSFGTYLVANGGLSADNATDQTENSNDNPSESGYALIYYSVVEEETIDE